MGDSRSLRALVLDVERVSRDAVFQAARRERFRFAEVADGCRASANEKLIILYAGAEKHPPRYHEVLLEAGLRVGAGSLPDAPAPIPDDGWVTAETG